MEKERPSRFEGLILEIATGHMRFLGGGERPRPMSLVKKMALVLPAWPR